jgi:hypothetical protein
MGALAAREMNPSRQGHPPRQEMGGEPNPVRAVPALPLSVS